MGILHFADICACGARYTRGNVFRLLVATLLLSVTVLVGGSVYLARQPTPTFQRETDPLAHLDAFERTHPARTIHLRDRYAGRTELLDLQSALPTWQRHPYELASAVYRATRQCPPSPVPPLLEDPILAKAYAWHARTCGDGDSNVDEFAKSTPWMHPSGRSYAALGRARSGRNLDRTDVLAFHVLELSALRDFLSGDARLLSELDARGWDGIRKGDRLVLGKESLIRVVHDASGIESLRFLSLRAWEASREASQVSLVPKDSDRACVRPASSLLCWQGVPSTGSRALSAAVGASAVLALSSALGLLLLTVRERRNAHADRMHVLRTLTHELRTPAAALLLDIEPLRSAYDDLPAVCQAPLLRISSAIARLDRVLRQTSRYMALFESGRAKDVLFSPRFVPSVRTVLEQLREEWPEQVALDLEGEDGPLVTDVQWLGVALRNLVENACLHGIPPVVVQFRWEPSACVFCVRDAGSTPEFSLSHFSQAHARGTHSAGLGLGLSIVSKVAALLRGSLRHVPGPTTFELSVPRGPKP